MGKLFIHGIPVNVPIEELHRVIPGEYDLETKVREFFHAFLVLILLQLDCMLNEFIMA